MDTTLRVGIYTRLSNDPDGTQTATARQEADCHAFAKREGWTVIDVYEDTDLSGFRRGVVRPDYERMLADLEARRIEAILVWKLDRLSRQPGQFEAVVSACERLGGRIHSVHESADMTSPAGLAMMRVGMAFAAMESQTMSLRIRRARAEQAEKGLPAPSGARGFGHTGDGLGIVVEEAALVREAASRLLAGEGLVTLAKDWERRGIRSPRGNAWAVTSLRRMLASPRLVGKRVHHQDVYDSDVIPPILEEETHAAVLAVLSRNSGTRIAGPRSRALSGLVFCGRCGVRLSVKRRHVTASNSRRAIPLYRCFRTPGSGACGALVVSAEPLEALVGELLVEALDSAELAVRIGRTDAEASRISAEFARLMTQREELVTDHYVHRLISRGPFMTALAALDERIARAEGGLARSRRAHLIATLDPGETIASAWASRPPAWRNNLAGLHIARVVVHPATKRGLNVLDPSRVEVVWREQ